MDECFTMLNIDYPTKADSGYYKRLSPKIFLMDDHKWSFYFWMKYREMVPKTLLHLDYHWDAINDFHTNAHKASELQSYSDRELHSFIKCDKYIRYDSFIAPAIISKIFNEVHFLCYQNDTSIGLDEELLDEYKSRQIIHKNISKVIDDLTGREVAFDLDLDIFNRSDMFQEGDIWEEKEIIQFLEKCEQLISKSPLITIALSYNCSGSHKDTRYLVELILPIIQKYVKHAF